MVATATTACNSAGPEPEPGDTYWRNSNSYVTVREDNVATVKNVQYLSKTYNGTASFSIKNDNAVQITMNKGYYVGSGETITGDVSDNGKSIKISINYYAAQPYNTHVYTHTYKTSTK